MTRRLAFASFQFSCTEAPRLVPCGTPSVLTPRTRACALLCRLEEPSPIPFHLLMFHVTPQAPTSGSHPPPCCRRTHPEGQRMRLTRLVRDEARELLFRELPADRPGTPSIASPFPELSLGSEPHSSPAQVPCEAPTPAFTRASSIVRVNEPMASARAESQLSHSPRRVRGV